MKKTRLYIVLSILLGFTFTACSDWLDVQPVDKTTEQQQYSSEEGILGVQNGLYQEMASTTLYGGHMSQLAIDALANRYCYYNGASINTQITIEALAKYKHTQEESKKIFSSIWSNSYKLIFRVNNYISNVEKSSASMSQEKKDLLLGEGYALRAYLHFDLFRMFGPIYSSATLNDESIPYNDIDPLDGDYTEESITLNNQKAENFIKKVLADIEMAKSLMAKTDPIVDDYSTANNIVSVNDQDPHYTNRVRRFNYFAVRALEARVRHYIDDQQAAVIAQEILDLEGKGSATDKSKLFAWHTDIKGIGGYEDYVFTSEVIFGLPNIKFYVNGDTNFANTDGVTKGYFEANTFRDLMFNLDGDIRKSLSQNTGKEVAANFHPSDNVTAAFFNKRYSVAPNTTGTRFYFQPLIRISEMYYIVAESKVRSANGDFTEAVDYINHFLNKIRKVNSDFCLGGISSPDLKNTEIATKLNEELLLNFITKEYYREFGYEGQVFFLLKRMQSKSTTPINMVKANTGKFEALPGTPQEVFVIPMPDSETDI
ncbi:MAG: RagB/SusD family nutrient uptake outer membrane protein [Dysgonomonas sp.]|nr:RagB/SusD family nutrient uptake outer membrane protein [Dysgonomonas sp.]